MTVHDLIEKLKTLPAHLEILIASDPEGNGFHELYAAQVELIEPSTLDVIHEDDADEYDDGELEERVILWP